MRNPLKLYFFLIFYIAFYHFVIAQDVEPNNTLEQAISINIDTFWNGTLNSSDQEDWYTVNIDTAGILILDFEKKGGGLTVGLYDGVNTNWIINVDLIPPSDSMYSFEALILEGQYYLQIKHNAGTDSVDYKIQTSIKLPKYAEDEEPNNSFETADTFKLGENISGLVGYWKYGFGLERDDYYFISVDTSGLIIFDVYMEGKGQLELITYDSSGSRLSSWRRNADSGYDKLAVKADKGGIFIKARSYLSSDHINYSIESSLLLAPEAHFEFYQVGSELTFENHSTLAETFTWDFGDENESIITSPRHRYDNPGVYETCLIARSAAGRDTFCDIITIKGLSSIYPIQGGNNGDVSISLIGGGLDEGSIIRLLQGTTILAEADTNYLLNVDEISGRLNLRGITPGIYKVEVENMSGEIFQIEQGFTVVEGGKADPWVEVRGRNNILFNRPSNYRLTLGNNGLVDASVVPVWIAISETDQLEVSWGGDYITSMDSMDYFLTDSILGEYFPSRVYGLLVPSIPSRSTIEYFLKIKSSDDVQIKSWVNEPYFQSPINESVLDCLSKLLAAGFIGQSLPSLDKESIDEIIKSYRVLTEVLSNVACRQLGDDCMNLINDVGNLQERFNKLLIGNGDIRTSTAQTSTPIVIVKFMSLVMKKAISKEAFDNDLAAIKIGNILAYQNSPAFKAALADCWKKQDCDPPALHSGIKSREEVECPECGTYCPLNIKDTRINTVASFDPNEKSGPFGFTEFNYVKDQKLIPYTIYFENKAIATAPAHEVYIIDTLDTTKFAMSSFRFGSISIADTLFSPQSDGLLMSHDIFLPELNVVTRITGRIDTVEGIVRWVFKSLDPITLAEIEDPHIGFLPPNDLSPEGEGSVSFTIERKNEAAVIEPIFNRAIIVFDANEPIITNDHITSFDTIPPEGEVVLDGIRNDTLDLAWSTSDTESGVRYYDIWVSENGANYYRWQSHTASSSGQFIGKTNSNYRFYSIAIDSVGNEEVVPELPDVETTVTSLNGLESESMVRFYPNPSSDRIQIENSSGDSWKATLYNMMGVEVFEKDFNKHSIQLNLGSLPSGNYVFRFLNKSTRKSYYKKLSMVK